MAASNLPTTLSVTNNCGGWSGTGGFTSQTAANAAGARYITGASNSKTSASVSAIPSSSSIPSGTASINLTATTATTSAYGRNMYIQYYVDGASTPTLTSSRVTSTSTVTSYTTSGLSVGVHTIVPVMTDRLVFLVGSSFTVTVNALATITTGTITGSPFCAGSSISVPFTISGTYSSNTFTAQLSDASGSFSSLVSLGTLVQNTAGTISGTIPSGTSTGTGYRIRVISSSPSVTGSDNGTDISINAIPVVTGQPANNSSCAGSGVPTFNVTATGAGLTYQWYEFNGSIWSSISNGGIYSNATTATLTLTNPSYSINGYKYKCTVTGTCTPSVTTDGNATLTVSQTPVGGTATPTSLNVCNGGTTSISLTGSTGTIQWQSSSDGGSTWSDISLATSTPYTTAALYRGTLYRAKLTSGICTTAYSSVAAVTISESNADSPTYSSSWSNGQDDHTTGFGAWSLTSTGGTASYFTETSDISYPSGKSWGMYHSGSGYVSNAVRPFSSVMTTGTSLTFSIENELVYSNGGTHGTVGFSLRDASHNNLMELFFVGGDTNYYLFDNNTSTQTSFGFSTTGFDIKIVYTGSNTYSIVIKRLSDGTRSYYTGRTFNGSGAYGAPAEIRFFNADGGNSAAYNFHLNKLTLNTPVITVPPSSSTQTVCLNGSVTALSVTAYGSSITYQWYSNSTSSNSGGSIINGATTNSYTPPTTISGTTYYYCVVSGTCASATSDVSGAIIVQPAFTSGTIAGTGETICYGGTPGVIGSTTAASGGDASITYQWQSGTDGSTFPTTIGSSNSATYTPAAGLTTTTYYRRQAHDGTCNTGWNTSANTWQVTVRPNFTTGAIANTGETVTYGSTASTQIGSTTAASGGDASITYQWQSSTDAAFTSPTTLGSSNSATYTPSTTITQDIWYRRQAKDGTCNTTFTSSSNTWKVTVNTTFSISGAINASSLPDCSTCNVDVLSGGIFTLSVPKLYTYNNVTIESGAQATLNSGTTLNVSTFTINSSASVPGTFVDLNTNGGLTSSGTISVNQYLSAARNWYMSSPVAGNLPAGYTYYKYDEPGNNTGYSSPATAYWESVSSGTAATAAAGYIVLPSSASTINFTGTTLNTGDKTIGLTRTTGKTKEGFNLIGNPYPSHVTMTYSLLNNANLLNSIWYRTAIYDTPNSKYVYSFNTFLMNSDGSTVSSPSGTTGIIPPMQAFWVRLNSAGSGSFTFTNSMRSHQTSNPLKTKFTVNVVMPLLRLEVSNINASVDEAVIYFNSNAANTLDSYDAEKMSNGSVSIPEIFTMPSLSNDQLAINGMNSIPYDTEIPLGFTTGEAGTNFSIKASEISNFDAGTKVLLKDTANVNSPIDISDGSSYTFSSGITNSSTRFAVIFKSASVYTGTIGNVNQNVWISVNGTNQIVVNGASGTESTVAVYNAVGQKLVAKTLTSTITTLNNPLQSGVYFVTVTNAGKSVTKKVILN